MYVAVLTVAFVAALYVNAVAHTKQWAWKIKLDSVLDVIAAAVGRVSDRIVAKIADLTSQAYQRCRPTLIKASVCIGALAVAIIKIAYVYALVCAAAVAIGATAGVANKAVKSKQVSTRVEDAKAAAESAYDTYKMRREWRKYDKESDHAR